MDAQLRRELQIRARIESIYNKREEDFESKEAYDDYLEEREDIIFNLCEGVDVKAIEAKVEAYRIANAESIAAVEARNAEEVRRRAAVERGAASPGSLAETLSGTAAAFEGGRDPEPHQGMDYTAQLPSGMLAQASASSLAVPVASALSLVQNGDIAHGNAGSLSKEAWDAMARASGWSPEFVHAKCREEAYGSVLVF